MLILYKVFLNLDDPRFRLIFLLSKLFSIFRYVRAAYWSKLRVNDSIWKHFMRYNQNKNRVVSSPRVGSTNKSFIVNESELCPKNSWFQWVLLWKTKKDSNFSSIYKHFSSKLNFPRNKLSNECKTSPLNHQRVRHIFVFKTWFILFLFFIKYSITIVLEPKFILILANYFK